MKGKNIKRNESEKTHDGRKKKMKESDEGEGWKGKEKKGK